MAAAPTSTRAIIAALAGNSFVTVIKLVAFALSGSGAMLSETIHSAADTGNQMLLYLGQKRARREADDRFHYGYGGERFIFGILSASGIFFIGCGVTLYHGVQMLLAPRMPQIGPTTFMVLGASLVVEGGVLVYAVRMLLAQRGALPFWRYVRERADPAAVAIFLEDGAAVLGLLLAGAGILLARQTGDPTWDAIGSIVVGVILGVVAVQLVLANREQLLGRAVPEGTEDRFIEILRTRPSLREVRDVKTREITPEAYALKAEITFDDRWLARKLGEVAPAELSAGDREAVLRRIATRALGFVRDEIAALENDVRAGIPQARHIDLEIFHAADPDAGEPAEG